MSDILAFIRWYLTISLVGMLSLPIAFQLFPRLTSRGYALIRPLSLLVWGFAFWMFGSLGILQNDLGGVLISLAILAAGAFLLLRKGKWSDIKDWVRLNWRMMLIAEIVFFVLFAFWTVVRAANPDAAYTEKPMELAFINSILKSTAFPPEDPWLSGYAISYYYFGYVLISMIIRITGVASSVAFNLGSSLWFGLTGTAAYGIVYDLISAWINQREGKPENDFRAETTGRERLGGLFGPFFLLIVGNLEGFFEVLYARRTFWKTGADGTLTSRFWEWLGIQELNLAPTQPVSWIPNRPYSWIWWRGSRVMQDISLSGKSIEIIDEFPFFTYLISDLHPHLLAMPFCLLAMALALNVFLTIGESEFSFPISWAWLKRWQTWLVLLILGSLAFFNTWDFPIYVGLFAIVLIYNRIRTHGWAVSRIWEFLECGLFLGIGGFVLFLPFYLGFQSQAGGLLPSLEFISRGINFWVMFGVFLSLILIWLIIQWKESTFSFKALASLKVIAIIFLGLFVLSMFWGWAVLGIPGLGTSLAASHNAAIASLGSRLMTGQAAFAGLHENNSTATILQQAVVRRVNSPGTWITLAALLFLTVGSLAHIFTKKTEAVQPSSAQPEPLNVPNIKILVLFMILIGGALTLFPEFFYLRDQFGWRMNTIFKFYFQAWMFWSLAAAFISYELLTTLKRWRYAVFSIFWVVLVMAGLAYPVLMVLNKTSNFSPSEWTLDGNEYLSRFMLDDYYAMQWLEGQETGVVAEAVGGSYTDFARFSTRTGLPTVLGWPGHESQWRGGAEEMGNRYEEIQRLYETDLEEEAFAILQKYDVRYVVLGDLERTQYKVSQSKFDSLLNTVYTNGGVTIYEVPQEMGD